MNYADFGAGARALLDEWKAASGELLHRLFGIALVLAVLMACSALLIIVAEAQGIRRAVLLYDPPGEFGIPPYAGFFSYLGILALTGAAAICLFALSVTTTDATPRVLFLGGLISALFAVDDLFMIHDWWLTEHFGIPETVVFALYGALVLALLAALGREALTPGALLLWVCLAFLALSTVLDVFDADVGWQGVAEEMTKLCAFVVWLLFWGGYARAAVAETLRKHLF